MNTDEILSADWRAIGLTEQQHRYLTGNALFSATRSNNEEAAELFQNADLDETGRRYFLDMLSGNNREDTVKEILPHLDAADTEYITKKMEERSPTQVTEDPGEVNTADDVSVRLAKFDGRNPASLASHMRMWDAGQKAQFQTDYAQMQGEERHRVTAVLAGAEDLELRASAISELLGNQDALEIAGWDKGKGTGTAAQASSGVAIALLKKDSDRAVNWVTSLPASETRTWTAKNLAANWRNYDPIGAENFVHSLPAAERESVLSFLESRNN